MNTVYNFAKHCMADEEFGCGGIPTKESYYLKKLDWSEEKISKFYDAIWTLKCMNDEANRKEREGKGRRASKR